MLLVPSSSPESEICSRRVGKESGKSGFLKRQAARRVAEELDFAVALRPSLSQRLWLPGVAVQRQQQESRDRVVTL